MKGLKLTDQEQTYYGELFQSCDVDGSGKVSGAKASELFKTSGLTQEILVQVTESCGAKRLGHFGRSQFYIALKLVAAAQCGLPISTDTLNAGVDVPLPKFHRFSDQGAVLRYISQALVPGTEPRAAGQHPGIPVSTGQEVTMATAADRLSQQQQLTGQLPPPPASKKAHARNQSGQYRSLTTDAATQQYAPQSDIGQQETRSPTFSPSQSPAISPIVSPQQVPVTSSHISIHNSSIPPVTISLPTGHFPVQPQIVASQAHGHGDQEDSPAHHQQQNNMGPDDIGWASFDDEEKHGLLGTGPKKNWEHLEPPNFDSSSISSDPESVDDVWSITDEQREYYVKQFQTMQPDISGVIVGSVAKEFFEKSKLPIQELSKIWQLSDINQDGALNLEEFCIAMHLVVLRRNEIEIPDRLPFALMPYTAFSNDSPFSRDLPPGSTLKRATPTSSPDAQATNWAQVLLQESPLTSSDMSSPGIKPANFEFQKPDASDPEAKIVHPVPMRMSPTGHSTPPEGRDRDPVPGDSDLHDMIETSVPITKQRSKSTVTSNSEMINNNTLQGRPRPVPKKGPVPSALPGNLLLSAVASSQSQSLEQGVTESTNEPPIPPPRPQQHGRSMSVDLKVGGLSAPPAVPPRASSKDAAGVRKGDTNSNAVIADRIHKFAQFQKFKSIPSQEAINVITDSGDKDVDAITNGSINEHQRRSIPLDYSKIKHEMEVDGAGESGTSAVQLSTEVRRVSPAVTWDLLGEDFTDGSADRQPFTTTTSTTSVPVYPVRDKKELQIAIRTHKERNSMLTRLNSELNQEYQEVMEQRIALEIQLEHLRPFSS